MSTENTTPPAELKAENWGDPKIDMMKAMDEFFEGPSKVEPVAEQTSEVNIEAAPPVSTPPVEVENTPEPTSIIEEEFFPDADKAPKESKPELKEGDFDEDAYDKQTEEDVKGMDLKAGDKFRALKAELKAAKQQTVTPEIQAKLEQLEIKAQEAEGLRLRIAEISSQSAKLQVENEEIYQTEIVEPAADIFTNADRLSDTVGLDPSILRAIIKERDLEVQEQLMEEHFGSKSLLIQSKVATMAEGFNSLIVKRERLLANAEKTIERSNVERIEKSNRLLNEQHKAVQVHQKKYWDKYKQYFPGFVEDGIDTPTMKKLMSKGLSIDFGLARAEDQGFAAFASASLPHALDQIAVLTKRLSAYEKADSKAVQQGTSAGKSVTSSPSEGAAPKDFMEMMSSDYAFTH